MAVRLHDKYALITGAGRGLGLEMAIAMGEAGLAGITITAAPGSDETSTQINNELQEAVSIIEKTGTKVNAMVSDVGRSDDCKNAVDSHMKSFPSLDILINNAGKAGRYAHRGGVLQRGPRQGGRRRHSMARRRGAEPLTSVGARDRWVRIHHVHLGHWRKLCQRGGVWAHRRPIQ